MKDFIKESLLLLITSVLILIAVFLLSFFWQQVNVSTAEDPPAIEQENTEPVEPVPIT